MASGRTRRVQSCHGLQSGTSARVPDSRSSALGGDTTAVQRPLLSRGNRSAAARIRAHRVHSVCPCWSVPPKPIDAASVSCSQTWEYLRSSFIPCWQRRRCWVRQRCLSQLECLGESDPRRGLGDEVVWRSTDPFIRYAAGDAGTAPRTIRTECHWEIDAPQDCRGCHCTGQWHRSFRWPGILGHAALGARASRLNSRSVPAHRRGPY